MVYLNTAQSSQANASEMLQSDTSLARAEEDVLRADIERMTEVLVAKGHILITVPVDQYIHPIEEAVSDPDDDIVDHIVALYEELENEACQTETVDDSEEPVYVTEAIACLEKVILHTEQQPTDESSDIRSLYCLLRTIQQRKMERARRQRQQTIDRWLL